ncbi:hypothetical protein, partial [Sphingorhabdus sp.]|uniref:hypothetical protein n=1 Tax=Sphingorhabdus sp. TaxID=1902408 RepID=UPI00333FD7C9
MADDVKVKFGGDFTDVPKGADSAGKIAGTAIAASFKEYTKSLTSSLASFFSVSNLVGMFASNFSAAMDKFREIDQLSRQLGVSRVELQKFSKLGAEVGISMETMARSIGFANKTIGAAQMHNGAQRQSLIDLGFTLEQITGGHIKATDVMFKLAEAYDKNKNSNNLAKQTTEVFGRAGQELTRILKDGNVELQERIRLMKVYSEQAVRGGASAARFLEKGQKKFAYHFGGKQAERFGFEIMSAQLEDVEKETRKEMGIKEGTGIQEMRESGQFPEFYQKYLKNAAKVGMKPEDVLSVLEQQSNNAGFFTSEKTKDKLAILSGFVRNTVVQEEAARNKKTLSDTGDLVDPRAGGAGGVAALAVSSLQAIGGG